MLHQRALSQNLGRLRARGIELRLCLRDVEPGGDAGAVALLGEGQRMIVGLYRSVEDRLLTVEASQLYIIVDELSQQREARALEIRRGSLRIGLACEDLVANLSPEVELVADRAAEDIVIVIARCGRPR